MNGSDFYKLDVNHQNLLLENSVGNKGKCISRTGGMCGDVYIFDKGENVHPRYVCAKLPKFSSNDSIKEMNSRFVQELKYQLSYYHHTFVHWAFDFTEVMGVPVALFRYWDSDLEKLINENNVSDIEKISIMIYACSGLSHCYKNGLISHQDLKPANIFLRNIKDKFRDLPNIDIYKFALIADFGLANAFKDSSIFSGTRPYMAPEQWNKTELSTKTDSFAIGVILYELLTGGFHPSGIMLKDYWPEPLEGNSKKWTREDAWKKWAKTAKINDTNAPKINTELEQLIRRMLLVNQKKRLSIDEVRSELLNILSGICEESFNQLTFLVNHFDQQVSTEPLDQRWSSLWDKWNKFQTKFQ